MAGKEKGAAACRFGTGPKVPESVWDKVSNHPCYSEDAHYFYARMHLPVAPGCNMECNYCNRLYDCPNESRPGVSSEILTPEEAAYKVGVIAGEIPELTVVGIAGPGDPLANPRRTFKTLALVKKKYPDIRLCLSTNGLMLPDYLKTIKALDVNHVTITINMVDPKVGREIYDWVRHKGKKYRGEEAAALLLDKQMTGLSLLKENEILCKVNSVMVPGINDQHLAEVSQKVKSLGAFLHNIIPFIPCSGSKFGDQGVRAPSAKERKVLQDLCESQINMMRHCRQCRADALGLLAEDLSQQHTREVFLKQPIRYDRERRRQVHLEMETKVQAIRAAKELLSQREELKPILVAVATKGGSMVNQHFGHAREFSIYESLGKEIKFVGARNVQQYCQGPVTCGDEPWVLDKVVEMLSDCQALLCVRIGPGPRQALETAGIKVFETYDLVINAVQKIASR